MMHELHYYEYSTFLTLTYDDENMPYVFGYNDDFIPTLYKKDLQRFFKRLRKWLHPEKIKYYACGEYGEINKRPHYHAIIFGLKPIQEIKDYIQTKIWKKGFAYVGTVTYQSARYTTDYLQKKWFGSDWSNVYNGKEREFQVCSQGLGLRYVEDYGEQIVDNLCITLNGVKQGIPRYYRKKLGIDGEVFKEAIKDKYDDLIEKYAEEAGGDLEKIQSLVDKSRLQSEQNLKAKQSLRSKTL